MGPAVRDQVLAANRGFYDALEALDLERMEACWASVPGISCLHPGGPWQRGWEEIGSGWEAIFSGTGYIEFDIQDVEVTIVDPVAWVTCTERITSAAGAGATAGAEVAATNLFVLGPDGWGLVLHHASPVIRPAPEEDA